MCNLINVGLFFLMIENIEGGISCLQFIFKGKILKTSYNKRVSGSVGWCFFPEPYGSWFSGLYGLNHSDSAAHANHYAL